MAEISAVLYSNKQVNTGIAASLSKINNVDWTFATQSYLLNRAPEYFVYLYSVSEQEHVVSRPPIMKEMRIAGRKKGERVAFVTRLPQPLVTPKGNVDSSEIDIGVMDTRRFVTDIINPDNLTINQDAAPDHITGQGNDLGAKGVFWSLNNPPTEEEIVKAETRLKARYKLLLEQARAVEVSAPAKLQDTLSPEHHMAADYFHETFTWHGAPVHKDMCPRCGGLANVGAPFHSLDGGGICVGDWKKAVAAGARSRAQAYEATEDEFFAPRVKKQAPVVDEE
jgi:hypothetical protein